MQPANNGAKQPSARPAVRPRILGLSRIQGMEVDIALVSTEVNSARFSEVRDHGNDATNHPVPAFDLRRCSSFSAAIRFRRKPDG
jgi:hypothetical protein